MARRISSGLVGDPSVGGINVSPAAVISSAENQNITLGPLGTGSVVFTNNAIFNDQSDLRFGDADSSNFIAVQAPSTVATNYTLTLPSAIAGTNGLALTSDTSGNLSWSAAGAALTDNNTDSGTNYFVFTTSTTGNLLTARVATTSRPLTYQPSTGSMQVTSLGVGTPASGTAGEIRATNQITSFYTSDAKFKENVVDIPNALDAVLTIGGKLFDWTDEYIKDHGGEDGYFIQKSDFGVIAQDVLKAFPRAVRTREDETLAVDYEKLSALAFAAIIELKQEIDQLKGQ